MIELRSGDLRQQIAGFDVITDIDLARFNITVGARKNRLDLSVGIALGSAAQIALFVAPVLVLLSYFIGPAPMDLNLWPGAVAMILFATLTASLVTTSGRSTWFVGAMAIMVYLIFATALYLLPPAANK